MRHTLRVVAVLLGAFVIACSGDSRPDPTPTTSPTATPVSTATATPSPTLTPTVMPSPEPTPTPVPRPEANPFPADLQTEALGLLQQLAGLRGVTDPKPVDMFLLTRDQARAFYSHDDPPGPTPTPGPPPLDPHQELYELLGLVPEVVPGTDTPTAEDQAVDNLIAIITGFYDPGYNAFYMIDTINGGIYGPLARSTIVHELTHALQYQAVDINRVAAQRNGNFDATTALLSVMEGDAVNSEIQLLGYSTRETLREPVCFQIPPSRNNGTPYAIERELDVWYEDGLCFVQAIAAQDPAGIQGLFDNLPTTMEQILHPEKYLAGEGALPVAPKPLQDTLGAGWQRLSNGTFGEFGLQNILLTGLPDDRTRVQEAAAGWGGDAWNLYYDGDARLLHLETVWDTAADAPQFFDALSASLTNRGFAASAEGDTTVFSLNGLTWSLTLRDDSVTVLVSNDAAALDAARDALALR